jgi:hypothetical protein
MRNYVIYTLHHILPGYQIKENERARHVAHRRKMRNAYIVLVDEPNGKNPLWCPRVYGKAVFK